MSKITIDRAVVEQALEALYDSVPKSYEATDDYREGLWMNLRAARRALRAALEQPQAEQEPVAVVTGFYGGFPTIRLLKPATVLPYGMALYAHPQPPHQQPLTDDAAKALCAPGPVYAPEGNVTRTPEQYRREIADARLYGLRQAERAHGIGGKK